jgi:hypothetical protein
MRTAARDWRCESPASSKIELLRETDFLQSAGRPPTLIAHASLFAHGSLVRPCGISLRFRGIDASAGTCSHFWRTD